MAFCCFISLLLCIAVIIRYFLLPCYSVAFYCPITQLYYGRTIDHVLLHFIRCTLALDVYNIPSFAGGAARRYRASSGCWRRRGTSWARAATATPWTRASRCCRPDSPSWRASAASRPALARRPPPRPRTPHLLRPRNDPRSNTLRTLPATPAEPYTAVLTPPDVSSRICGDQTFRVSYYSDGRPTCNSDVRYSSKFKIYRYRCVVIFTYYKNHNRSALIYKTKYFCICHNNK